MSADGGSVPFDRVKDLVVDLLDLPPEQRRRRLDADCPGDAALRAEVESLLAHGDTPCTFLDGALLVPSSATFAQALRTLPHPPTLPDRIGNYRILGCLATGGMGTVYRAEQDQPRRTVALKTIRRQFQDDEMKRRFHREAELLGRLQHRGIAAIFDAGNFDRGDGPEPYFVMEFVEGQPLTDYARQQRLGTAARVTLLADVCDAVHYAHQKGIVHRDLKPDNILVDASGQPKILDFGIARALDSDAWTVTAHTEPGQILGTLAYASPEQVTGDPSAIDARSDVFMLGVVLFELLGGRPPFDVQGLSITAAARVVCEQEPPRLGTLVPSLRGDLETITAKALEKEPDRRYASVHALAEDLRRHLARVPIAARPPSVRYHLHRFAQRHKALVAGVAATMVALVAGAIVAFTFAVRAAHNEEVAEHAAARASVAAADATLAGDPRRARRHLEGVPATLRQWEWHHLASCLAPAGRRTVASSDAAVGAAVAFAGDGTALYAFADGPDLRVEDLESGRVVSAITAPVPLRRVALDRTGTRVLAFSADRTQLLVWDTTSGALLLASAGHRNLRDPCFSANGERIAFGVDNGSVRVLDVAGATTVFTRPGVGKGRLHGSPSLDPTGGRVVFRTQLAGDGGTLATSFDCATGARGPIRHSLKGMTSSFAPIAIFGPDGTRVAASDASQTISVLDAATGRTLLRLPGTELSRALAFAERSERLASASAREVQVWDLERARELASFDVGAHKVALDPQGRQVAAATAQGGLLWRLDSPRSRVLTGHRGRVLAVTFHPDGTRLASLGTDNTVRVWDLGTTEAVAVLAVNRWQLHAIGAGRVVSSPAGPAFAADGSELFVAGLTRAWRFDANGQVLQELEVGPTRYVEACGAGVRSGPNLCVDSRGRGLQAGLDGIRVFDPRTLQETGSPSRFPENQPGSAIAASRDGTLIATGHEGGWIRIWSASTGAELRRVAAHDGIVYCLAFSPDGMRLVSGGVDFSVRLWDVDTLEPILELRGHENSMRDVAFSPDGSRIASCGSDGKIRLWDSLSADERKARVAAARSQRSSRR